MKFKKKEARVITALRLNVSTYNKLLLLCKKEDIVRAQALEQIVEDYFEREPVGMGAARE